MDSYRDLILQTFDFPTEEFNIEENKLYFNNLSLTSLIEKHGTPFRLTYLPKISSQIKKARKLFGDAMKAQDYNASYTYAYCTKSSHFSFILEKVLRENAQIETSSAYDMAIIRRLHQQQKIDKDLTIIANGFKRPLYTQYIAELINSGFHNCIPILDNINEINYYEKHIDKPFKIGMRLAADEEPNFNFYTSRLGIRYKDTLDLYKERIAHNKNVELKVLHYFINTGIKDTSYYWSELSRFIHQYCELRQLSSTLDTIDIGGGFPIKTSLFFDYEFEYMTGQIISIIKRICNESNVPVPHIITEFGTFTVGETGAMIYSVLDEKLQNDKELWYMIDGSFITHLPDSWALNERFLMLAVNNWDQPFQKVNLGGLTCDSMDYYNSEIHSANVYMPRLKKDTPQYIGFFHTGAYQESLAGFGGIQHCLIPNTKHIVIDYQEDGTLIDTVFSGEQSEESMLDILGY